MNLLLVIREFNSNCLIILSLNMYSYKDEAMKKCNKTMKCKKHSKGVCNEWNPLLLIIPLRLGLNEFNQDYKDSIKVAFTFYYLDTYMNRCVNFIFAICYNRNAFI